MEKVFVDTNLLPERERRKKKFVKRYIPRDQSLATVKRPVSNQLELKVSVRKDGENGRIDRHQSLENGYLKSSITIERNKKLVNGDIYKKKTKTR